MDSAYLLETLAGNFMDVVQYNDDNRGFEVRERERDAEANPYYLVITRVIWSYSDYVPT